jgi:hypothetical protein
MHLLITILSKMHLGGRKLDLKVVEAEPTRRRDKQKDLPETVPGN